MNELLRPAAAANRLGVTTETLREWERAGTLPAYKTPGGHARYRTEDIDTLVGAEPPTPFDFLEMEMALPPETITCESNMLRIHVCYPNRYTVVDPEGHRFTYDGCFHSFSKEVAE